ncbi:MAG: PepSY-like domain-containing protein [Methylococcales bacterium]
MWVRTILTLISTTWLVGPIAIAGEIDLSDTPQTTITGFQNDHPDAKITAVSREIHFDETLYEIKFKTHGKYHDQALYDARGQEFTHEEKIKPAQLPMPVTESIKKQFSNPRITRAEEIHHPDGRTEYEINLIDNHVKWELAMNPEGQILVKEQE